MRITVFKASENNEHMTVEETEEDWSFEAKPNQECRLISLDDLQQTEKPKNQRVPSDEKDENGQ
jgi:hypothetical protein